jgi:RNA polymerase sigma-70 factor (ECF subfamily)
MGGKDGEPAPQESQMLHLDTTQSTSEIPTDVSEGQLIEGLLADDPKAWRALTADYTRLVLRCIHKVTRRFPSVTEGDVDEIYATYCLQLLSNDKRKLRSFQTGRGVRLGTWLGMLATHCAWDHLRQIKREPVRALMVEAEDLVWSQPSPEDQAATGQEVRALRTLLEELTDKDRQFVVLYFSEGLSPEVVAERMGISVKTVYTKKHKIRARLQALRDGESLAA